MTRNRSLLTMLVAIAMLAGLMGSASAAPPEQANVASYIVVLKPGAIDVARTAAQIARSNGGRVGYVYQHAIQGFSMTMAPQAAVALARNPRVAYVETNDVVNIAQTTPTGIVRMFASDNATLDIDGLDDFRVDVDVAVIDTGVDFEHPDLNVVGGVTCKEATSGPRWRRTASCSPGGDDDHYHGTHVAGTIGALDNGFGVVGVAPGARIWAVKVLSSDGSGSEAAVVAGIDWVAANADTIEVANMSLGGSGYSQAEYDAIQGAVNKGVAFAVAAGNDNANANNYSPASFDNALTVSALADFDGKPGYLAAPGCRADQDDTLASFSNWGPAVDIAAPGVCILSTYPIEQGSYGTISGTSMAAPHAAGALALLASTSSPTNQDGVQALYDQVISSGNLNWFDDSGDGIQERLLDVAGFTAALTATGGGGGGGGGGDTNTAPDVSIDSPTNGTTIVLGDAVDFIASASDAEDGTLDSTIDWTSSLDGPIGTNSSTISPALSVGTHTITASVQDSGEPSKTASDSITVTVTDPEPPTGDGIDLSARGYKRKGHQRADLTWSGADGTSVLIYRNGSRVSTTPNDGNYTDSTGSKGGGSASYQVCAVDTTTCSNLVTVIW